MPGVERADPGYRDVVPERRVRQALVRLNPDLPPEALDDAFRKLTLTDAPENNDWLAVYQFTVAEGQHTRRPDVVLL